MANLLAEYKYDNEICLWCCFRSMEALNAADVRIVVSLGYT